MDWRDEGVLLTTRRHGESAAIIEVLTAEHGLHAGLVRGGASQRMAPVLQPGTQLEVEWRGRLAEHLGNFRVEPVRSRAVHLMSDRLRLAGFNALSALLVTFLPEREPNPVLYDVTLAVIERMTLGDAWPVEYALWELELLAALGFPLDLTRCAASGTPEDLAFVSPKTGRAVSRIAARGWEDRLIPLPPAFGHGFLSPDEVPDALRLTGYFLTAHVLPNSGRQELPLARERFFRMLAG